MTRGMHGRNQVGRRCQKPRDRSLSSKEARKTPKTKRTQNTHVNKQKDPSLGIPNVLKLLRLEKCTQVIPVKVQPILAEYIRQEGGSTWIRGVILEKLQKGG